MDLCVDGLIVVPAYDAPAGAVYPALIRVQASLISPGTEMAMVRSRRAH